MERINILHLGVVLGAAACIWLSLPEAQGRSMRPAQLLVVPLFAAATALILLLFALTEPLPRRASLAAFVLGLAAGGWRGWRMQLRVDQVLSRLRLPAGRDGLWASLLLAAAVLYELVVAVLGRHIPYIHVFPSPAAIASATYLAARALALRLRLHYEPHHDFRVRDPG